MAGQDEKEYKGCGAAAELIYIVLTLHGRCRRCRLRHRLLQDRLGQALLLQEGLGRQSLG